MDDESDRPSNMQPTRWRLRFGLKALFIATTLLSVWLGYKFSREHQADEIIARHTAVLDSIATRIANGPADTFYEVNPGSEDEISRRLNFP